MSTSLSRSETARINGAKSTGPVTSEGLARSSQNAIRHGLTSRRIVIPGESEEAYRSLLASVMETHRPGTELERELAENIAASLWRLNRSFALESQMLLEQANRLRTSDEPPARETEFAVALMELMGNGTGPLSQLHRHEARLHRQYERAVRELRALVAEREQQEAEREHHEQVRQALHAARGNGCPSAAITPRNAASPAAPAAPSPVLPQNEPRISAAIPTLTKVPVGIRNTKVSSGTTPMSRFRTRKVAG